MVKGMMPRLRQPGLLAWLAVLMLPWGSLHAQSVSGRVTDAESGETIPGALVSLLDRDGRVLSWDMADGSGRYEVAAPEPGSYRLGVHVVGRTLSLSAWFEVEAGEGPPHSFLFDGYPVQIAVPVPGGGPACTPSPSQTLPVGRAWREIEKALANLLWARQARRFEYAITQYQRRRPQENGDRILQEEHEPVVGFVNHSFEGPSEAELERDGFVVSSGSALVAVSPDPSLFLSAWFKRRYCLRLTTSPAGPETVAIEFIPVGDHDETTDIQGLFVIDRASAALTSLHYRYSAFPVQGLSEAPGGWMTFERLPHGAFFVSEWEKRLPQGMMIPEPTPDGRWERTRQPTWLLEEGGYVTLARTEPGDSVWRRSRSDQDVTYTDSLWALGPAVAVGAEPPGSITGVTISASGRVAREGWVRIIGSVRARESGDPIPGAIIRIDGIPEFLADDDGRFIVEGVPSGRRWMEVEALGREPAMDTLTLENARIFGIDIQLSEDPIELEPLLVEVEARSLILDRAGFYVRRDKSGISGTRITREEIEERPGARLTDILSNVPGTRLFYVGSPPGAVVLRVNRSSTRHRAFQPPAMPGCEPAVYVDGLIYYDQLGSVRITDFNFLSPQVIEGIEIFTGLAAPARFDSDGCGVVLIWTRGG